MIVFLSSGTAYTWKTAYDENYARFSPGQLLVEDLTRSLLDDPYIRMADSCAVHDHPVMSRIWTERCAMSTLVIAFDPARHRDVRQVIHHLNFSRNTRTIARRTRDRLRKLAR